MDDIVFSIDGVAWWVTLNRPWALNALSLKMGRRLDAQLLEKYISIGQVLGFFETNTA